MQTIVNNMENEGEENKSVLTDNDRNSVHSNWSKLMSVNEEVEYSKLKSGLNVDVSTSCFHRRSHEGNAHPTKKKGSEKHCISTI